MTDTKLRGTLLAVVLAVLAFFGISLVSRLGVVEGKVEAQAVQNASMRSDVEWIKSSVARIETKLDAREPHR